MPDKKLTDLEIVKALECCTKPRGRRNCEKCHYFFSDIKCKTHLLIDTLDLINRLQAENERLRNAKYIFASVDYCADDLDKVLKENERLKAENESFKNSPIIRIFETWRKDVETEAYKEFADKLKLHAYTECGITGYKYQVVQIEEIDNLLKEMVGGDNTSLNNKN